MEEKKHTPKISRRSLLRWGASSVFLAAIGGSYWSSRWKYIVIHHSAGNYGNIKFLQEVHRQRQSADPIDAIPYHFIVGNGNGMQMGEIASDWRQHYNLWGAHISAHNSDRNYRGLGICLIGNLEKNALPEAQYHALVKLVNQLVEQYSIKLKNITGHGNTNGESTLCPGQYFPMQRLLADIVT